MTFKTLSALTMPAVIFLAACGGDASSEGETVATEPLALEDSATVSSDMMEDGTVVLTVDRLVSEDSACLMMMSVVNGLDEPATAGLFTFNATGNGETAGGNMFPQTVDPGESKLAQIILPGSDCDDVQVIEGGQLNCTLPDSDRASCLDDLEVRDSVVTFDLDAE